MAAVAAVELPGQLGIGAVFAGVDWSEDHHDYAIVDAAGAGVSARGDIQRPVYPRSAIKILQALPLVESGAADRFGLTNKELALACASHDGEAEHVRTAASMLLSISGTPE